MKVIVTERVDFEWGYEELEIVINDNTKFKVGSYDAPEDNTLSRNFSDCYDIPELLRKAYDAGRNGEKFEIEYVEGDDV